MPADALAPLLDRVVRRLRGLSTSAWSAAGRREAVAEAARQLAALDPAAAGRELPPVPDHAWADAVVVLAADAVAAGADHRQVEQILEALLAATR